MIGLGDLPGGIFDSGALDVSANGSVIVGFGAIEDWHFEGFRWTAEEGMLGLGDLAGGPFWSDASAISAEGSTIVGFSRSGSGTQAFRWTAEEGMIGLGDLPGGGSISYALGISADGSTIVGYAHSYLQWEAFRWTAEGGMIGLGILPGQFRSVALDVSGDGSVIVGRSTDRAFRWTTEDGIMALESSSSGVSPREAWGISRDGNCIVGHARSSSGVTAFMWTEEGGTESIQDVLTRDFGLDLTGWKLTKASDISDDGLAIVGVGINPDGYEEAWMAIISEQAEPVACIVGGDRVVEAGEDCEGRVVLDGSCSSDADSTPGTNDDINDFDWYEVIDVCDPNSDIYLGSGEVIECNLGLGEHVIVLEVTDKAGAFDSNEVTITVEDVTPPEFVLTVEPAELKPHNHQMVLVTPVWDVNDNCDEEVEVSLLSITSSQADDGIGDGKTTDDILITEEGLIYLRAEIGDSSEDRIYTLTFEAADDAGNSTIETAIVTVPQHQLWLHQEAYSGENNLPL
jgi:probable HAF family extracellular repeat protein